MAVGNPSDLRDQVPSLDGEAPGSPPAGRGTKGDAASVTGTEGASSSEVSLPLLQRLGRPSSHAAPAGQLLPKKGGREK